jgi:hypothetical protein
VGNPDASNTSASSVVNHLEVAMAMQYLFARSKKSDGRQLGSTCRCKLEIAGGSLRLAAQTELDNRLEQQVVLLSRPRRVDQLAVAGAPYTSWPRVVVVHTMARSKVRRLALAILSPCGKQSRLSGAGSKLSVLVRLLPCCAFVKWTRTLKQIFPVANSRAALTRRSLPR